MDELVDRFTDLDPARWVDSYLPAWSSRAAAAATYRTGPDGLVLSLPPGHGLWCPGLHDDPPLRVSAVQSGSWSGPVGSTRGQQPFRPGLLVAEEQPRHTGILVRTGRVEVTCRATVDHASMFSAWMIGMEDEPERSGEICLVEVFGSTVGADDAAVGTGIHAFRDPALVEEFAAEVRVLDPADWHTYAVDWSTDGVRWTIDGTDVRASEQSPSYPMLLVLGVFDFPADRTDPEFVPTLEVREVRVRGEIT